MATFTCWLPGSSVWVMAPVHATGSVLTCVSLTSLEAAPASLDSDRCTLSAPVVTSIYHRQTLLCLNQACPLAPPLDDCGGTHLVDQQVTQAAVRVPALLNRRPYTHARTHTISDTTHSRAL